ncbi:hypothetical protein [Tenacibaculum amylolyticum]|uniref:hypothetical protein n=1 Tax=Tenacibaculum amylolyticum TaxID=104269 RepID=UPI003893300A
MEYYFIGQHKKVCEKRTGYNSIDSTFFRDEQTTRVPDVIIYKDNKITVVQPELWSDIIGGGGFNVYSDKICGVLKTLELPIVIKPVRLVLNESGHKKTGYNLVLKVPDIQNKTLGTDPAKTFDIDQTQVGVLPIFDLRWKYGSFRVINTFLKEKFDKLKLAGVHIKPLSELTSFELQFLLW